MTPPRHSMLLKNSELHEQGERVAYDDDGDDDLVHGEVRVDLDFRDGVDFDVDVSDDGELYIQYWLKTDRTPEEGDGVIVLDGDDLLVRGEVVDRQNDDGITGWWVERDDGVTFEVWDREDRTLAVIP